MSLQEEWRFGRLDRQEELKKRQVSVHSTLREWQRNRSTQEREQRRDRLAFVSDLQAETKDFLRDTSNKRHQDSIALAQQLNEYVRSLSAETNRFLQETTLDRVEWSSQLARELHDYHSSLNQMSGALRQQRVEEIQSRKAQIQAFLSESERARHQSYNELHEKLTNAIDTIRLDVESYLQELELLREDRARQLQQAFSRYRAKRKADSQELRDRLSVFRSELKDYVTDLQLSVWGSVREHHIAPPSRTSEAVKVTPVKVTPAPVSSTTVKKTLETPKPLVKPVEVKDSPKPVVIPSLATAKPSAPPPLPEERVYHYIQEGKGVRLTEIEAALGINRVQTVDALRALLRKGLIIQRDRTYLTPDQLSAPLT